MANVLERLPENVPGDFFVDASCIDCDTCSQLAPEVFRDHGDQCSVYHQPEGEADTRLALMALVACPTGSIGTTEKHDAHIGIDAFPSLIAENVYFCGFTSESSFGAWSYLIVRPESEGGNVLIDSPRFATQLVKRIEKLGGVRQMLLTHRDDVADHELFRKKFGCERIMHADDGAARLGVERIISGEDEVQLDNDLLVIPTPGHTRGHVVFLYQEKISFHRRPSGLVAHAANPNGLSQRRLVFVGQADGVDAPAGAVRFRVGLARPRLNPSRQQSKTCAIISNPVLPG